MHPLLFFILLMLVILRGTWTFLAPYDINEEVDSAVGREVAMETGTVQRLQPIRSQYTEVER